MGFLIRAIANVGIIFGLGLIIDNWDHHKGYLVVIGTLVFLISLEIFVQQRIKEADYA